MTGEAEARGQSSRPPLDTRQCRDNWSPSGCSPPGRPSVARASGRILHGRFPDCKARRRALDYSPFPASLACTQCRCGMIRFGAMTPLARYEVRDRVAVITVDNPPVNALSAGVPDAISEGVQRACADPAVNAIVLIGAGTTFIAG